MLWALLRLVPLFLLAGCTEVLPGTAIATFRIEGELLSNNCAPGFEAPATLTYTADIRRAGTIGYFRQTGKPFVQGTINANGTFQFVGQTSRQVIAPVPAQNVRGCTLIQSETIAGTLTEVPSIDGGLDAGIVDGSGDASGADGGDAGVSASSFVATDRVQFSPAQGSDCSRTLIVNGGGFPALPCTAEYRFIGTAIP